MSQKRKCSGEGKVAVAWWSASTTRALASSTRLTTWRDIVFTGNCTRDQYQEEVV